MIELIPPFSVIPMPIDKDGNGPAEGSEVTQTIYEVWDAACQTASTHNDGFEAHFFRHLLTSMPLMISILKFIEENGEFTPLQYIGGYDQIPFTHAQYCALVKEIMIGLHYRAIDASIAGTEEFVPIKILVMPFTVGGSAFILRHLECGEHVDQLMTQEYYASSGFDV